MAAELSGGGRTDVSGSRSISLVRASGAADGLARPNREDHAGRDLLDPRLQVGEEPKRMLVGPVRIVDEEGERPLVGQPRAQPVQAVESCEQAIVGGGSVGNLLEQRARQSRGTCEDPFALALCERLDASAPAAGSPRRARTRAPSRRRAREERPSAPPRRTPRPRPAASSCRSRALPRSPRSGPSRLPRCGAHRRSASTPPRARADRCACSDPSSGAVRPSDFAWLAPGLASPIAKRIPPGEKPAVGPRSEERPAGRSVASHAIPTLYLGGDDAIRTALCRAGLAGDRRTGGRPLKAPPPP